MMKKRTSISSPEKCARRGISEIGHICEHLRICIRRLHSARVLDGGIKPLSFFLRCGILSEFKARPEV